MDEHAKLADAATDLMDLIAPNEAGYLPEMLKKLEQIIEQNPDIRAELGNLW